jgi:Flp pilus assembly protein TadG
MSAQTMRRVGNGLVRRLRAEDGTAVTEMALVLPLLLLLLLGMIDFGKAINYWIDETHLANEGARMAMVNNNPGAGLATPKKLQRYILDQADTAELHGDVAGTQGSTNAAKVNICFFKASDGSLYTDPATAKVGDTVEVVVRYDYKWLKGFPFPGNPTTSIVGKSAMRLEALPTNYSPADNIGGVSCPSAA